MCFKVFKYIDNIIIDINLNINIDFNFNNVIANNNLNINNNLINYIHNIDNNIIIIDFYNKQILIVIFRNVTLILNFLVN